MAKFKILCIIQVLFNNDYVKIESNSSVVKQHERKENNKIKPQEFI